VNVVNLTRFPAELAIAADKDGAESYLVVVKGTFRLRGSEAPVPADEQVPFFYADQHYGDPATTSIRYESEFAPRKPRAEVVLVGSAYAPRGRPARRVTVEMRVGKLRKRLEVTGDRRWRLGWLLRSVRSSPRRFTTLPIVYERAFGAQLERRNPVGTGLIGRFKRGGALPNFAYPRERLRRPGGKIRPAGLGFVGRGWLPRADFAGTYDDAWREQRFPLLPDDFDERYHQGAPDDQCCDYLVGGERVELVNLSPEGRLSFALPDLALPLRFRFQARTELLYAVADTLILEPDAGRFQVVWRASRPVTGKLLDLGEVWVGQPTRGRLRALENRKRYLEKPRRTAAVRVATR
jgi:hypothetical protein